MANISTADVRREKRFNDTIQSVFRYAHAFEKDYEVRLFNALVLEIVDEMMSSNFSTTSSKAIYRRYIPADQMKIKTEAVLPLLVGFILNAEMSKTLGITHLDNFELHIFTNYDNLRIIRATDEFMKNYNKPTPLHTRVLYRHARALLDRHELFHNKQGEEELQTFTLSLNKDTTDE